MSDKLIKDWLESERNYTAGTKLYEKFSGNAVKSAFFLRGENPVSRDLLIKSMVLLKEQLTVAVAEEIKPEAIFSKHIITDEEFSSAPPDLKKKIEEVKMHYRLGSAKKAKILSEPNKTERGILANEVRDHDEAADKLFAEIDFYKQHKFFPDQDPAANDVERMSDAELFRMRNYLRPWLSRHKKNPAKAAEVETKTKLLQLIEKRIDNDSL